MNKQMIKDALVEFFSEFTLVTVHCEKKIQEQQFEPYTVSAGQAMIVHVDEKDEAYAMMMENCDRQIVQEFRNRGFELEPEE